MEWQNGRRIEIYTSTSILYYDYWEPEGWSNLVLCGTKVMGTKRGYRMYKPLKGEPGKMSGSASLYSVFEAYRYIERYDDDNSYYIIYVHDAYVYKGITEYMHTWYTDNWTDEDGEVINADLWKKLYEYYEKYEDTNRVWVRMLPYYAYTQPPVMMARKLAEDAIRSWRRKGE